jgi:hypothetical protein
MKRAINPSLLRLEEYETKTSRFMLWWVSLEEALEYSAKQRIAFGRSGREKSIWEQLLINDLIICLAFDGNHINRYAYRISGKSIKLSDPSFFPDEKPYLLFIQQVGFGERTSVKGDAFFQSEFLPYTSRPIFQELWEECYRVDVEEHNSQEKYFHSTNDRYNIHIASSHDDYNYVVSAAAYHPFGPKRAFVTLVAEQEDQLVGAILLELEADARRYHRTAVRLFRSDYPWIKQQAVHISRIYNSPSVFNKWELHKALLKSAITIAPSLVTEPISIVQGISYDYHPVAIHLGFNVEVPRKLEDTFYYWKEFNLPPRLSNRHRTIKTTKESIHPILRFRKKIHYWLALGTRDYIDIGIEKTAWALHRHPVNTGRWKQLLAGHVIFLMSEDKRVRAYGIVTNTAIRNVEGLKRYPLWIDFHSDMVQNLDIDISQHLSERWFSKYDTGGLIPLPEEFGARLKSAADSLKTEGKMWVEPNPYLLHQTEFQVTQNQVFIVQSWSLREKVLPVIKDILSEAGYIVKYSGDREGQVVFEIIWQLLNESEIVLVDFTDKRPNVYLEYGMALVLGKPIIAITQDQADIPSDTLNLKYIVYQNELGNTALKKLPQKIRDTISDIQNLKDKKALKL